MECPAAISYALNGVKGEKIHITRGGYGNTIDDLIEDMVLSILHNTPKRTITTQLDLSMDLKAKNPLTEEDIKVTLNGKPDVILNELDRDGKIKNKIIEVKYFPHENLPYPQHTRQVSLYAIMYYHNTKKAPEAILQYFLTNDPVYIKKVFIESVDTYPEMRTSFVKNYKISPGKVLLSAKEAIYNLARAIAMETLDVPFGQFECHLCPYFNKCKALPAMGNNGFLQIVNFSEMMKNNLNVPSTLTGKLRDIALATNAIYLKFTNKLKFIT